MRQAWSHTPASLLPACTNLGGEKYPPGSRHAERQLCFQQSRSLLRHPTLMRNPSLGELRHVRAIPVNLLVNFFC